MKKFIGIISIFLCLGSFVSAQEEGSALSIRLFALGVKNVPKLRVGEAQGSKLIDCRIRSGQISDRVLLKGMGRNLTFFFAESAEEASSENIAAQCVIPNSLREALLLFLPNPSTGGGKPPMIIRVLDGSDKAFPSGGALVLNLYSQDVRFMLGEHVVKALPAGENVTLPLPTKRDNFNMSDVVFQFQQDEKWRTAKETRYRFIEEIRRIMVTYVDPGSKRPRLKVYKDVALDPSFDLPS